LNSPKLLDVKDRADVAFTGLVEQKGVSSETPMVGWREFRKAPGRAAAVNSDKQKERLMKRILGLVVLSGVLAGFATGCSYGGVSASGDKAVVARNDGFLFGILRKVYVCKITDAGVTSCQSNESP
jgi:hypothetical protein